MMRSGLVALALTACSAASGVPGSDIVGTFRITAEPLDRQCTLSDMQAQPFEFLATLSRNPVSQEAWLTLRGYPRSTLYDGQFVDSVASARRTFSDCSACETSLNESIALAVFSESQALAVGSNCPTSALDGGVPAVDDDAGILAPAHRPLAEAAMVCGEMKTQVTSANLCPRCEGCGVHYRLRGVRQ